MNMFLTPTEVAILTSKKRPAQQIQALRQMGIPYFVNISGRPIVTTYAVTKQASEIEGNKPVWKSNHSKSSS